ncbi:MAG: hypothetical protein OWR52_13915 [Acidibacillus sp.]|nr:hypothetical protein [Acidibacillus sp.]
MEIVIFGDDLTGCNATAMLFHRIGWNVQTILRFNRQFLENEISCNALIWNSGTRLLPPKDALYRLQSMFSQVTKLKHTKVLFAKRIDSTFRGPIGCEVDYLLSQLPHQTVGVIVAAFPSSGRTVCNGKLYVNGQPVHETEIAHEIHIPIPSSDIAEILRNQSNLPVFTLTMNEIKSYADPHFLEKKIIAQVKGHCLLVCDASTDEEINTLGQFFSHWHHKILPVDPGPFTVSYVMARKRIQNHVLIVSGSRSSTISTQLNFAEQAFATKFENVPIEHFQDSNADPLSIKEFYTKVYEKLNRINVSGFRTDQFSINKYHNTKILPQYLAELTAEILSKVHITGLYVSGGEVAYEVLHRLKAEKIEPIAEVAPLCILSRITTGPYQGLRVITKGGSIGEKDIIVKSINLLLSGA